MKKVILPLLIVFILVVILVLFRVFSSENKNSASILPQNEIGDIVKEIGKGLEKKYDSNDISYSNKSYVWWISPEELNIFSPDASQVSLELVCKNDGIELPKEDLNLVLPTVDNIFTEKGFKINDINSSNSIEDDTFYDYVKAYEKGNIKCTLTSNPDCYAEEYKEENTIFIQNIRIACTNKYEESLQRQSSYLKDLGIKDAIVNVEVEKGDFIRFNIGLRRTGYYIIAKNENGKWNEIFKGQDIPSCELINEYNIPEEIYKECY